MAKVCDGCEWFKYGACDIGVDINGEESIKLHVKDGKCEAHEPKTSVDLEIAEVDDTEDWVETHFGGTEDY